MEKLNLATDTIESKQVLWADIGNDGDKDLYATNFNAANRLYLNNGSLGLINVTQLYGLPIDLEPTFGATFGDYNKDRFLDIYVVIFFNK